MVVQSHELPIRYLEKNGKVKKRRMCNNDKNFG